MNNRTANKDTKQEEKSKDDLQKQIDSLTKQIQALASVVSVFAEGLDKLAETQAAQADSISNLAIAQENQVVDFSRIAESNLKLIQTNETNAELLKRIMNSVKYLELFEERTKNEGGIFISYSHADRDAVNKIAKRFQADNINYWLDDKDILVGEVIDKAISKGIQNNALFLVVLSPTSIKSKWVEREFDEASYEEIEGKKIILPIVVNGLPASDIPARIRRKLYVSLSDDFEAGYKKLRSSIVSYILKHEQSKAT
jgi:hypothetical protein